MANGFGQNSAPLASGTPTRSASGFEGTPFEGLASLLQGPLRNLMAGVGMAPMGLHDQNVFDFTRNRQFNMMQNDLLKRMVKEESDTTWTRNAQSVARVFGVPFGEEQKAMFQAGAGLAQMAGPMLATSRPGVLETLGGTTGSSTVMAARLIMASRQRMDPLTGQMGMDVGALEQMSKDLSRSFDRDPTSLRGFTKGQMGGLALSLQQRGMLGGLGPDNLREFIGQNMAASAKAMGTFDIDDLPADAMQKLQDDPATASKLRAFDARKVKQSLGNFTGAMAAMRDVMSDLGRVPKDIEELMRGLDEVTAGGIGQISPQRLAQTVRTTRELAKGAGVPIQTALALQRHAVNRAQQLGLHSLLGVQANQGALAFGGAYRGTGQGKFAAWGSLSSDQAQQMDSNLRVNAAASDAANRAAVVMRLRDLHGGFAKGSEAEALAAQIETGTLAETPDIGRLTEILTAPEQGRLGITSNQVQNMMSQRFMNQEAVHTYNIGDTVRRQQPKEFWGRVGKEMNETIYSRLVGQGVDPQTAHRIAQKSSGKITQRVQALSRAVFTDPKARNAAISDAIKDTINSTDEGREIMQAMGKDVDTDAWARGSADDFFGEANAMIRRDPRLRGLGGIQGGHQVMSEEALRLGRIRAQTAEVDARASQAMELFGRGTALRRLFTGLQESETGDAAEILAGAMGGVKFGKMKGAIVKAMEELIVEEKEKDKARAVIANMPQGEEREAAMKQMDDREIAITKRRLAIEKMMNEAVKGDVSKLTPTSAAAAKEASKAKAFQERLATLTDRAETKLDAEKDEATIKAPSADADRKATEEKPSDGDDKLELKITGKVTVEGDMTADGEIPGGKHLTKANK
jgi:hypothetical protein